MSISAISTAAVSMPLVIVRPKPSPGESSEFFRSMMDDVHPSSHEDANRAKQLEVAGTVEKPRSTTSAERQAERAEYHAGLRAKQQATRAERQSNWDTVIEQRVQGRRECEWQFRQIRGEARANDDNLEDAQTAALREIRGGVEERLGMRDGHAYADLGTDLGLFQFAESNFGDSCELSWRAAGEMSANDGSVSPGVGSAPASTSSLNFTA